MFASHQASGVRTGGGGGGQPVACSIDDRKINENLFLERSAFFHTKIAKIAILFFCAIQLAYIILKNFHRDVKLFWRVTLDVDD